MSDPALQTTAPAQLLAARQKVVEAQQLRDGAGTALVELAHVGSNVREAGAKGGQCGSPRRPVGCGGGAYGGA